MCSKGFFLLPEGYGLCCAHSKRKHAQILEEEEQCDEFKWKVDIFWYSQDDAIKSSNMSSAKADFKNWPLIPLDVETSFSTFQNLFFDRYHYFTEQNLKQSLIVNCFCAFKV